jgi:transposase-like protein
MTTRKRYTSEDKVGILREHLEKNIAVPDVCEKYRIHPNLLYKWKKELFEKAVELFSKKNESQENKKIAELESTLKNRNEVIAELLEENLKLKK